MTTAPRGHLITLLLRAGFLAAALAIIAGIFGMHIMTGAHSMTAHAVPVVGGGQAAAQPHTGEGHSGHETVEPVPAGMTPAETAPGPSSSCSATGTCHEISAGGAACVLAPGNTSITAPLPGTAPYGMPDFGGAAAAAGTNYSYLPGSPSPGDLCISRT